MRLTPVALALELELLWTVTVKVTSWPALGVASSTVLVTDRSTLLTVTLAVAVLLAPSGSVSAALTLAVCEPLAEQSSPLLNTALAPAARSATLIGPVQVAYWLVRLQ